MISFPPFYLIVTNGSLVRTRDRPDTIRCIVASLVGDGESGDSLVDENEPIQPINQTQMEDYSDTTWEPEPIDAGPGMLRSLVLIGRRGQH